MYVHTQSLNAPHEVPGRRGGGQGSRGSADLHACGHWLCGTVERERKGGEAGGEFSLVLAAWKFILPKLRTCIHMFGLLPRLSPCAHVWQLHPL